MSRSGDRKDHPVDLRLVLLENDSDDFEKEISALESRINKMLWTMVGILVSTTTAAILLSVNLVVNA